MVVNNPNNWHWVDKNCTKWSKQYFSTNIVGLQATRDEISLEIHNMSLFEGEVEISQCKGKIISLYDLKLGFQIKGHFKQKENSYDGSIKILDFSYDTDLSELEILVEISGEMSEKKSIEDFVKKNLITKIIEKLKIFRRDLVDQNSSEIQVEKSQVDSVLTKLNQKKSIEHAHYNKNEKINKNGFINKSTKVDKCSSNEISTTNLVLKPYFSASAEELYLTLLTRERISAWSRSEPIIEDYPPSINSEFKFFNGFVSGRILELVPNKSITKSWRLDYWKPNVYSRMKITFEESSSDTMMKIDFTGVPVGEDKKVAENFEKYYIKSIKVVFGFGAVL